jgi:uncharacterized protein YbaA (DUF1428 family)
MLRRLRMTSSNSIFRSRSVPGGRALIVRRSAADGTRTYRIRQAARGLVDGHVLHASSGYSARCERHPGGCLDRPTPQEHTMSYIDGFVIAVPTANKQRFIDHASHFDPIFLELGAMRVVECWGDDVPDGKLTDFRRAVQATAEETVAFAWVEWPDKATRDAGMKKMMEDPRMDPAAPGNPPMPFDGKRMIFGGFERVVEVKA